MHEQRDISVVVRLGLLHMSCMRWDDVIPYCANTMNKLCKGMYIPDRRSQRRTFFQIWPTVPDGSFQLPLIPMCSFVIKRMGTYVREGNIVNRYSQKSRTPS